MGTHPLWRPFAPSANEHRQSQRVAQRQVTPGALAQRHLEWSSDYVDLRAVIEAAVADQVVEVRHVGSTAIAGLPAKPIIDIDLTVHDVTDEDSYLPALREAGFRLTFRDDVAGEPHRQLTYAAPNANLHVWSPGAIEPQRHALFVRWLIGCAADRERYIDAKREAARDAGGGRYNDLKAAVMYDIYERAFCDDQSHQHDSQPRPSEPGRR